MCYGEILGRQERDKEKSPALIITVRVTLLWGRFRNLCNTLFIVCFSKYCTETWSSYRNLLVRVSLQCKKNTPFQCTAKGPQNDCRRLQTPLVIGLVSPFGHCGTPFQTLSSAQRKAVLHTWGGSGGVSSSQSDLMPEPARSAETRQFRPLPGTKQTKINLKLKQVTFSYERYESWD